MDDYKWIYIIKFDSTGEYLSSWAYNNCFYTRIHSDATKFSTAQTAQQFILDKGLSATVWRYFAWSNEAEPMLCNLSDT